MMVLNRDEATVGLLAVAVSEPVAPFGLPKRSHELDGREFQCVTRSAEEQR
jgi:hypothetical protein